MSLSPLPCVNCIQLFKHEKSVLNEMLGSHKMPHTMHFVLKMLLKNIRILILSFSKYSLLNDLMKAFCDYSILEASM